MVSKSSQKKVYLILASRLTGVTGQKSFESWCEQLPSLSVIADVEPLFVYGGDAASSTPEVWTTLAREIHTRQSTETGFVILHGLDQLLYASTLATFLLSETRSPVIFTGGDSLTEEKLAPGFTSNLINAVQVATFDFPDVCLLFGNRLLRANLAQREHDGSLNIFTTSETGVLGRIDFSVRLYETASRPRTGKTGIFTTPQTNLALIDAHPFWSENDLHQAVEGKAGVLIRASETQSLPEFIAQFITQRKWTVPVVVWAPQFPPDVQLPKPCTLIRTLTWESTVAKCMWALGKSPKLTDFKDRLEKNIAGELLN